ncbi:hypothetical protein QCE63_06120 [Caballeronia sp. LZ065]|uniref:hypothetical protein n=1 Tax=Caballeronia sp. LZ065 TaxID=3038571 RepID=UPI00286501D7|nr:hypothetical protein [Caballeronia sp. LZ065]MDR5779006.1 hypothetical protein [Caballeronia sp. LZ065]
MSQEVKVFNAGIIVQRRRDVLYMNSDDEARAAAQARMFLADSMTWSNDRRVLSELVELIGVRDEDAERLRKTKRAIETGELVTVPDRPARTTTFIQRGGGDARPAPKSREAVAALPLFQRATEAVARVRPFEIPARPPKPRNHFFAIMAANPGDVLPDGTIATALETEPFVYVPHTLSEEAMELAAKTNNPDHGARMLGYERDTFGAMLHVFKPPNGLRPNDNVIFYDDGSVEFKKQILDDNIHNYAP